jgi:hypothetical protein
MALYPDASMIRIYRIMGKSGQHIKPFKIFLYLCEATLRAPIIRAYLIGWILVFAVALFGPIVSYAARAENARWSIDFNNIPITDALTRLSQVTGIKVFTKKPLQSKITRSYTNRTIDEIIRDLFRNMNCASVWYYSKKGVDSIGIVIFEGEGGGDADNLARARRTGTRYPGLSRDSGYVQPRYTRQVTDARKSVRGITVPKAGQGATTGRIDTEDVEDEGEADKTDEESMSPSPDLTEKSKTPAPDLDEESPLDSPEEE